MDPKIWKKTQDTLGKLIKKPPLTEKLLSKPPFRFLHDIMTSVVKTTGFMQGLFTPDEMISENVKEKDSKIAFLQKAIDIVVAVTGKSLSVKPVKIVAGHEPEKTNEFLQVLADAVNKNVDNDDYVKKVLGGGGGKSSGKEERREKERERTKSADRRKMQDGEDTKNREKDGGHEKGDRERRHERDRERHKEKEKERESKTREKSRDGRDERHRDRSKRDSGNHISSHKKTLVSGGSNLGRLRKQEPSAMLNNYKRKGNSHNLPSKMREDQQCTNNKAMDFEQGHLGTEAEASLHLEGSGHQMVPSMHGQIEGHACGDSEAGKQPCGMAASASVACHAMFVNPQGDGLGAATSSVLDDAGLDHRDQSREKENESPARINGEKEEKQEPPARLQRPSSAKGSRRRREGLRNGDLDDDDDDEEDGGEGEVQKDKRNNAEDEEFQKEMAPSKDPVIGDDDLPPQIAAARQLARPSSARPAPPRPKQEASESEPAMRLGGGQPANLIVDDDNDDDEDDDNFLVEESAPPPAPIEPEPMSTKPTDEDDAEHGALVKKMLESKKELEGGSQNQAAQKKTEIERPIMSDAQRRKQREIVQKEIDKLRASIQSLTRSANPLGKVMDYVQEDLDSMQQELDKWKIENTQHAMDLKKEMSVTDRAVEPLKQQLANLERAISDQLDQIAATKCNIIKNDQKIEKMLRGITSS